MRHCSMLRGDRRYAASAARGRRYAPACAIGEKAVLAVRRNGGLQGAVYWSFFHAFCKLLIKPPPSGISSGRCRGRPDHSLRAPSPRYARSELPMGRGYFGGSLFAPPSQSGRGANEYGAFREQRPGGRSDVSFCRERLRNLCGRTGAFFPVVCEGRHTVCDATCRSLSDGAERAEHGLAAAQKPQVGTAAGAVRGKRCFRLCRNLPSLPSGRAIPPGCSFRVVRPGRLRPPSPGLRAADIGLRAAAHRPPWSRGCGAACLP